MYYDRSLTTGYNPSWLPRFICNRELEMELERTGGIHSSDAPVSDSFSSDLHLVVLVNRNEQREMVRWSEIPRTVDDFEGLFDIAFWNFKKTLPSSEPTFILSPSGLTKQVTFGNSEDSLLLVAGSFWRRLFVHCKADILAACPTNETLLVADAGVPGARIELQARTDEIFKSASHPLSNRLISWGGWGWSDES